MVQFNVKEGFVGQKLKKEIKKEDLVIGKSRSRHFLFSLTIGSES